MSNSLSEAPPQPSTDWKTAGQLLLPFLPGYIIWGIATAVAMLQGGLSLTGALLLSFLVYAGAAQIAALPLILIGAPLWLVTITGFMVNSRFILYSALITPYLSHVPRRRRLFYAYLNVDLTLAVLLTHFQKNPQLTAAQHESLYRGGVFLMWLIWQSSTLLGFALSSLFPTELRLDFMGVLVLILIALPLIYNRATWIGVIVAGSTSTLFAYLPFRLGILAGICAGLSAALFVRTLNLALKASRH